MLSALSLQQNGQSAFWKKGRSLKEIPMIILAVSFQYMKMCVSADPRSSHRINAVAEQLGKNRDGKVWKTSPFSLRRSMGGTFARLTRFTSPVP